jgi:hypothetical protein
MTAVPTTITTMLITRTGISLASETAVQKRPLPGFHQASERSPVLLAATNVDKNNSAPVSKDDAPVMTFFIVINSNLYSFVIAKLDEFNAIKFHQSQI